MYDNAEDLKNKAVDNKPGLRKQYVTMIFGDGDYDFRIAGIGEKAVKIEKFIKYDDIIDAINNGADNGLEAELMRIIEEYEPEAEEE
ncbi:hypothetical protein LJC03_05500 [Methanobrevibacter sp. OttesenSCG-928-I08]|nr:hypothetical protein [Methanobrevibacter sp. OttesenSCG-928-I08]